MILDQASAETFVQANGDARWDGWDIVIFKADPTSVTNRRGVFRNGKWGQETRVSPDFNGNWRIPSHARSSRGARR